MWRINRSLREYLNIHFLLWKVISKAEKQTQLCRHFVLSMEQMPQARSKEMTVATVREQKSWGGQEGPRRGVGEEKEMG